MLTILVSGLTLFCAQKCDKEISKRKSKKEGDNGAEKKTGIYIADDQQ